MSPIGIFFPLSLRMLRTGLCAIVLALFVGSGHAADGSRHPFDLPAGDATETLKQFGAQAKREIIFPTEAVAGVRTHALKGIYTAREALDRMVADTGLTVAEDEKTGALMIFRAASPKPPGAAPPEKKPPIPPPLKENSKAMTRKTPLALLGALFAFVSAPAQNAPADPNKPDPTKTEPVMLSEFRVDTSRDRGYLATNATTGTRLNMPIKQIPMPIEVVTREFIDDIGAVDIKEALQYSAGIVQDIVQAGNNFSFSPSGTGQTTGALAHDSAAVNIRGFNTRSFLRSGFRQDTVTDVVNVDRQEIARGPQSLLYGIAALGGIVNITPKYPRANPRSSLRLGYGSNEFYRAEAYTSGPVFAKSDSKHFLNYGVGAVFQNTSSQDDFDDRRRILVTPAFDYHPFEKTNVFVDIEYGQFRATGNGFKDVSDASAGNVRNSYGLRIAENANDYNETLGVARDRFGRSRFFRWSGSDTFAKDDYFSGTIEVTQKLPAGLTFVASANYSDRMTKRLGLDSQGVATSNTASPSIAPTGVGLWTNVGPNPVNPTQTYWKTINYQWFNGPAHKLIRQTRFDLNYEFKVFGNKQSLLMGRQEQTVTQSSIGTAQVTSNTPGGTNRSYIAFNDLNYIRYQGEQTRIFRDDQFSEWNTGLYAIYLGQWWNERITTIAGVRNDRYMVRDLAYTYVKADATLPDSATANWVRPATFDASATSAPGQAPKLNGYRFGAKTQRDTNPTFGVSAAVTKDISLYAVSAAGIYPNTGQRDGAGEPFKAEKTKSKEIGVKFDLWKDQKDRARISASGALFRIDRQNAIYNLFWAPQPRGNNLSTLRSGFTANTLATGTGPDAYSVTNSAFTTFQTKNPVTYLLPVSYVPAADQTHPRVAGAPQQGGYILVDYASLGSAAADPLRRAMNAATTDGSNLTALQTGTVGSGATALNANNAYFNRNSDTSYNDKTQGFDIQLYFNLTDNYSAVLTYTYLSQGVTGGFRVVDQPNSTEYDSWWNYMGVPLADRAKNLNEASYDFAGQILGARTIDNPRNSFALWNKYTFSAGKLKGLDVGLGVTVNGPRQSQVAINNGARNLQLLENQRFRPPLAADYKLNLGLGYRAKLLGRQWNLRLNVNNLLDQRKKTALGSSTLYITPVDIPGTNFLAGGLVPSTMAGAQKITVPERAVRYFEPISFRLTAGANF